MGKPGKLRSGMRNKVNRWAKGGSSISNPSLTKFREKARSSFFQKQPAVKKGQGLTKDALNLHNQLKFKSESIDTKHGTQSVSLMEDDQSDSGTVSAETFGTFLSGLSDCTNVTFNKIQRYWQQNMSQHKEVCAVLAAITEVIREQKSEESDTAYFAALVTALSTVEKTESAAAISYLLSMTAKNVPVAVLRVKFGEVSKLLCGILAQVSAQKKKTAPTALMRAVFSTLATLLRHQELSVWDDTSTMKVFDSILLHINHSKPKVRKAAQDAVCLVLHGSDFLKSVDSSVEIYHPAAVTTAQTCIAKLKKLNSMSSASGVCHILLLIGRIFPCLPQPALKKACEAILQIMILGDSMVKFVCLKSLKGMFTSAIRSAALTPELNAQIINALYDYYPNASDFEGSPAWLSVMQKAIINLSSNFMNTSPEWACNSIHLTLVHVPKLLVTCFKLLLSTSSVVQNAAADTAKSVLKDGVGTFWKTETAVVDKDDEAKFVVSVFKSLEEGLKYKYHGVWNLVFQIVEACFSTFVKQSHFLMVQPIVESIVNLRITPHFQYRDDLDLAAGSAVAALGPKLFLQAAPLQIDGSETDLDFPRSWLLPLLKKSIKKAELSFFVEYFLPLASQLRVRAIELQNLGRQVEATAYNTLHLQCWDLLPVFCREAVDISIAFPKIARVLGRALSENKELQQLVMSALRNVIACVNKSEKDHKAIVQFAKNFLPLLFNIYTDVKNTSGIALDDDEEEQKKTPNYNKNKSVERLASLETIRIFLTITPRDLIITFFLNVQKKAFQSEGLDDASRLALLDLLIAMVSYVTTEHLENIFTSVKGLVRSTHLSMQKKSYRILQEISSSKQPDCLAFVHSHLRELEWVLVKGLRKAASPSKGPRVACIEQVFITLHSDPKTRKESKVFLRKIIPEVILCTKESKRSRVAAFNLLITGGKLFMSEPISKENSTTQPQVKLGEYFDIINVGLTGASNMMRSTIIALSRLIFEFKDEISSSLLNTTIDNVCVLLSSNAREVTAAAFGFLFVLFRILDKDQMTAHVSNMLKALENWNDSTRRYFRMKVKKLLTRLVRRYGFDSIASMLPEAHRKQLDNVRKLLSRAKKMKLEASEKKMTADDFLVDENKSKKETMDEILADSSESDMDVEDEKKPVKRKKKKKNTSKSATWLQEAAEEPLDLLDPSVSQKMLMSNPKTVAKPKKDVFQTAPDGRLIIYDGEIADDDNEKFLKSVGINKKRLKEDEELTIEKKKKRRYEEDSDDDAPPRKLSYKPGGKGIHREHSEFETGSKFKAKKAGGDVKRKGSQEPFAYLPFNNAQLNKRKMKKLKGQYTGFIKAAKKGAASSSKTKHRKK